MLDKGTFNKNMTVSTEGIIGHELRGLIEQCISLDEISSGLTNDSESSAIQRQ